MWQNWSVEAVCFNTHFKIPDVKCLSQRHRRIRCKRVFPPFFSAERQCPQDEFQCNNTLCKPLAWKCDGEDDCGDNSDENPEECSECSVMNHRHLLLFSDFILCVIDLFFFLHCASFLCTSFSCLPLREVPVSSHQGIPLPKRPCLSATLKKMRQRQ